MEIKDETSRGMDSAEKILFHKEWIEKWENDPLNAYPIYIEISPVSYCNHKCIFCAFDYINQTPLINEQGMPKAKLRTHILKERLKEMAEIGVKAVQYAGEGEPLIHPDLDEIVIFTKKLGIEISILTNGVLLSKKFIENGLSSFSWFQVSLDAAEPKTHAKIHKTSISDFPKIISSLEYAARFRNYGRINCDIGVQMILLPMNIQEVAPLIKILKKIKVDYLTIKPYSHHLLSKHSKEDVLSEEFSYSKVLEEVEKKIEEVRGDFAVDLRKTAMREIESNREYDRCFSVPYAWAYICANGDVYSCSAFVGDDRFLLGNINEQTFKQIWQSEKRRENMEMMKYFDIKKNCRRICRMNMTNKILFALRKNPSIKEKILSNLPVAPKRVNFI